MRQDVSAHRIFQRNIPRSTPVDLVVRADRVRELRGRRRLRRQACRAGALGHCWPGGLRPPAPALIPRLARDPRVLCRRLARFARQCQGKVDLRSQPFLRRAPHRAGRLQKGPAQRRADDPGARQEPAAAAVLRTSISIDAGICGRSEYRRLQVSRVQRAPQ